MPPNGKPLPQKSADVPVRPSPAWRNPLLNACMENLRRHEFFVMTTWWLLCRLKILDLSLRVLPGEPMGFEDFRRRLCDMSMEDCERRKEERLLEQLQLAEEESDDLKKEASYVDLKKEAANYLPGVVEQHGCWSVQENAVVDGFRLGVVFS